MCVTFAPRSFYFNQKLQRDISSFFHKTDFASLLFLLLSRLLASLGCLLQVGIFPTFGMEFSLLLECRSNDKNSIIICSRMWYVKHGNGAVSFPWQKIKFLCFFLLFFQIKNLSNIRYGNLFIYLYQNSFMIIVTNHWSHMEILIYSWNFILQTLKQHPLPKHVHDATIYILYTIFTIK